MLIISDNKTHIIKDGENLPDGVGDTVVFIEYNNDKTSIEPIVGTMIPSYVTKTGYTEMRPCDSVFAKVKTYTCTFGVINKISHQKEYPYNVSIGHFCLERILCYKVQEVSVGYNFYFDIKVTVKGHFTLYSTSDINKFFTIVVPLINKDLDAGMKPAETNLHKYDYVLEDKYIDEVNDVDLQNHIKQFTITDIFRALHEVKVELDNFSDNTINIYLYLPTYNSYIMSFLESTLGSKVDVQRRGKDVVYKIKKSAYYLERELYLSKDIRKVFVNEIKYNLVMTFLLNMNETELRSGYIDVIEFRSKKKLTKNKEMFFLFNKLENLSVFVYYEGVSRVGRDDHTWTTISYVVPIEDNVKLPDYVIDVFNKNGIELKYEEDLYRYFYSVISDKENNDTYFGRSGGKIDNSSMLFRIYLDLLDYFEKKE